MTRTERLLKTLILLVLAFISYIFYLNYDSIIRNFKDFINLFKEAEVIVPYDKTINHLNYQFKTVSETDNFKPTNIEDIKKIYYTVLNNGWTEFTFYCPKEYENCMEDVRVIADRNEYISQINNYVSPYNSYIKYNTLLVNDDEIHLTVDKLYTNEEIKQIDLEIDSIFQELGIKNNNDTFNNIKKIHNYLIENITYDENYKKGKETISNKANGALFNKVALCSGYSDLFSLMLNRLNVPNFRVSNDEHIWNVIYYGDKWYHIDVTWDDDERNKNNTYNFYMVTTDELLEKDKDIHNFIISDYLELN